MARNSLQPTLNQSFRIVRDEEPKGRAVDFSAELRRSRRAEQEGAYEQACEIRFAAVQELVELLPEDEVVELDWEDVATRDAVVLLHSSAVDFFLVGDLEMAAAQLELLLDVDGDDHLEATTLLALIYVAMGEWDSFDDITLDLADKSPERSLALLWARFRREGALDAKELAALRRLHPQYLAEWCADEHPADGAYLADIASERPSKGARARELWLQTEPLWTEFHDFIEALRRG